MGVVIARQDALLQGGFWRPRGDVGVWVDTYGKLSLAVEHSGIRFAVCGIGSANFAVTLEQDT